MIIIVRLFQLPRCMAALTLSDGWLNTSRPSGAGDYALSQDLRPYFEFLNAL